MNLRLFNKHNTKFCQYDQNETIESVHTQIKEDLQLYINTPIQQRVEEKMKSFKIWCTPEQIPSFEDLMYSEKESDENFKRIINQSTEEYYLSDRPVICCITGKVIPYNEHYYVPKTQFVDENLFFSKESMGIITEELS